MFSPKSIQDVLNGDEQAVNRFCASVGEVVFRHAVMVCGSTSDAADVAQVTVLRALRNLPALRNPESGRAWVFRIARRVCVAMQARSRRDLGTSFEPESLSNFDLAIVAGLNPESAALLHEQLRQLGPALRALPEAQRCILLLHDYEGMSTRETAHIMAISEENVRTQLSRARRTVRLRLRRLAKV